MIASQSTLRNDERSRVSRLVPRTPEHGQAGDDGQHPEPDRERARCPQPVLDHPVLVVARRVVPVDRAARVELVEHEHGAEDEQGDPDIVRAGPAPAHAQETLASPSQTIAQAPASTAGITISSSRISGATSAAAIASATAPARRARRGCARRGRARASTRSRREAPRRSATCRRTRGSRRVASATRIAAGRETTNRASPYAGKNARLIASTPISFAAS